MFIENIRLIVKNRVLPKEELSFLITIEFKSLLI